MFRVINGTTECVCMQQLESVRFWNIVKDLLRWEEEMAEKSPDAENETVDNLFF